MYSLLFLRCFPTFHLVSIISFNLDKSVVCRRVQDKGRQTRALQAGTNAELQLLIFCENFR